MPHLAGMTGASWWKLRGCSAKHIIARLTGCEVDACIRRVFRSKML